MLFDLLSLNIMIMKIHIDSRSLIILRDGNVENLNGQIVITES